MAVKASASITLAQLAAIAGVTRYYQLAASTASTPAKPTTNPPASAWTSKEPAYDGTTTSTLYLTDLTVFTDGTFAYSDVNKSSSYEAAKQAYNKAENAQNTANAISTLIRETTKGVEVGKSSDGSTYSGTHTLNSSDGFYVYDSDGTAITQIKGGEVVSGAESSVHTHVKSDGFHIYGGDETELARFSKDEDSDELLIQGTNGIIIKHEGSSIEESLDDGDASLDSYSTTVNASKIGVSKNGKWDISTESETIYDGDEATYKNIAAISVGGNTRSRKVRLSSYYCEDLNTVTQEQGWMLEIHPNGATLGQGKDHQSSNIQYGLVFNVNGVSPVSFGNGYNLGLRVSPFKNLYTTNIGDSSSPTTNGYFTNLYLSGTNYATNIKHAVSTSLYSNTTGATSVSLSAAITGFNYILVCIKNAQGAHHWVTARAAAGDCPFETHGVTSGTMWVVFGSLNLASKTVKITSQVNMPITGYAFGTGSSNIDCKIVQVRGCY